tara:strand:+ start:201 stop:698 length:498 start_codon:yes stop_codon:yes gene_type:complete
MNTSIIVVDEKQKQKDIEFGSDNEKTTQEEIEDYLGLTLMKYKDKFSTFDFYNTERKILCELKSRRNDDKKYKTQLIGQNKINKARVKHSDGFQVYFFWKLTNSLYVWKYDPKVELETRELGNFARGDKTDTLYLIENKIMTKVKANNIKNKLFKIKGDFTLDFT